MVKKVNVGYIGWFAYDDTDFSVPYAVCDIRQEKVDGFISKHPEVKGYTDYREMARDPELDVVIISTPNWLHCEMSEAFLENGKDVFCEKPMGINKSEMDRMLLAQRRSGKQLALDFEMRISSGNIRLKEMLEANTIGTVKGIEFVHHRGCWEAEGNGIWRTDPSRSGGLYFMEVCHEVDFFRFLMGEITDVQSFKFPNTLPQYPEDLMPDNIQTHLWFENGIMASISTSHAVSAYCPEWEQYHDHGHDMFFIFYGDKGAIRMDVIDETLLVVKQQPYPDSNTNGVRMVRDSLEKLGGHDACHDITGNRRAFIKAVAEGRPHVQDAYDAWRTHCVCLAAEKSALDGFRKIKVDYTEPQPS